MLGTSALPARVTRAAVSVAPAVRLLRLALILWSFAFLAIFGTILPAELAGVRVIGHLAYGVPLAIWAVHRVGRHRSPIDWPLVTALGLFLVTALASRDRQASLEMLGGALALSVLCWLMLDVARHPALQRVVAMTGAASMTMWLMLFAIRWTEEKIQWVALGGGIPMLVESTQSLFWLTPNIVPVLALLGIGFVAFMDSGRMRLILWSALVASSLVAVPISGGRAGWLGLVLAGVTFLALTGAGRVRTVLRDRRWQLACVAAALLLVAAAVVFQERALTAASLLPRVTLGQQALAIFGTDPLTGSGPGTYAWARLEHITPYQDPLSFALAHNVPLQTLADGGLLLAGGLSAVLIAFATALWRNRRRLSRSAHVGLSALAGLGFILLLDDHSSLPAVAAMIVTLGAWVLADATATRPEPPARPERSMAERSRFLAPLLILLILALPAMVGVNLGRVQAESAREAALDSDLDTARAGYEAALVHYPDRPGYRLAAGLLAALEGDDEAARHHYRLAAAAAPGDPRAWGALAELTSDEAERLELLTRAAERGGRDARYAYRMGQELQAAGRQPEAVAAFARAAMINPGLLMQLEANPSGDGTARGEVADYMRAAMPALAARANVDPAGTLHDVSLALGPAASDDLPPAWGAVAHMTAGRLASAADDLAAAQAASPRDLRTWLATAEYARLSCDAELRRAALQLVALSPFRGPAVSDEIMHRATDYFRENGLGSYQPVQAPFRARDLQWPDAFTPERSGC